MEFTLKLLIICCVSIASIAAIDQAYAHHQSDHCNVICGAGGDTDGDGVPEPVDQCPLEPENYNGFEDNDGCPDGVQQPPPEKNENPPTNMYVEQVGSVLKVSWEYDNESFDVESWELKRKASQGGTVKIKEKVLDPNKKIKNPIDATIQIDYVLDTSVIVGTTYQYEVEVKFTNDKKAKSTLTDPFLVEESNPETFRIDVNEIETTLPLIPRIDLSNIFNVLFIDYFPIIPNVYSPNPVPILTTALNPVVPESYLFSLEPIPTPSLTIDDCSEKMFIDYKRSDDFGQTIYVLLTILQNNTVAHSHLFDITDVDKRIFNHQFTIELEDQVITDFENLELQIDIQAETVIDSNDYRQLSIHGIEFQIPSDDLAC